jgi:squalene-hopene/tetraprenyl-beta-curcumene cyclase
VTQDAQDARTNATHAVDVDWASRHWSVDENPGMGMQGLFYYCTVMAKALSIAGGDTLRGGNKQAIAWRQDLTAKLASLQRPDGSWANTDNTFWERDPALITAYALLTSAYAL